MSKNHLRDHIAVVINNLYLRSNGVNISLNYDNIYSVPTIHAYLMLLPPFSRHKVVHSIEHAEKIKEARQQGS